MKKIFIIAAMLGWAMSALAQTVHTYGVNNDEAFLCHVAGDTVVSGGYARRNASGQPLSRLGAIVTWFVEGSGFVRSEYFDTPANDKVIGLDSIQGRLFATVSSDQVASTSFVRVLEDSIGGMAVKDAVTLPSGLEISATCSSGQRIFMVGSTGSIFPDMVLGAYVPGDTIALRAVVMPQVQRLYDVALINDSLLVAVGQGAAASASSSGVLVVGFRPNLDTIFTKTILIGNAEIGYGLTVVDSSLAYIVGRSNQGLGNYDAFVLPLEPSTGTPGTTALVYGQSGNEVAHDVAYRNDTLCVVGEAPDPSGNPNAMRLFVDAATPTALFLLDSLDFGVSGKEDGLYSVYSEGSCWVAVGQMHSAKNTALAAQGLVYLEGDCYPPLVSTSLGRYEEDVLSVYPNPIASRGIVKIAGLKKRTSWKLFNALGQVVFYGEAEPGSEMQAPDTPGVYFLCLEGEKSTIKILVQ